MLNAKMFCRTCTLIPATVLALLTTPAQAAEVRGLMKLGFDFGGDTLATAYLSTGGTSKVKMNEGMYLSGGMTILTAGNSMSIDLTAAWKYTSIDATNQSVELTRFPLEALAFYNFSGGHGLRLGGGLAYQLNTKYKSSGEFENLTVNFDDALGYVVQLDYLSKTHPKARGGLSWGLRYTAVDYEYEVNNAPSTAGNGLGIFVGGVF